jgi:putative MATE family efflux protein
VVQLAWPAILQGLLTTVIFITDRIILGQYSEAALGSMQISGPLLWSVFSVFGAFGAGTLAVIGRSVGSQDAVRARQTLRAVIWLAFVMGSLVALLGIFSREWLAEVLAGGADTSDQIRTMAVLYMEICFGIAPFAMLGAVGFTALQAGGDTRSPAVISLVCGVVNLSISVVCVFGLWGAPELGIVGAALGTAASYLLQGLLALYFNQRPDRIPSLRPFEPLRLAPLKPVLRISLPAFGEKVIFHTAFVIFASFVGHLGDQAMTANQACIAIESLGFIAATGFGIASGALVAQKLGAQRPEDAESVGWISAALGGGLLTIFGLIFLLIPELLLGLIIDDPDAIELGATCLRITAISQPLMAIHDSMAGALRGAGDTRSPMIVTLVGSLLMRIGACYVLAWPLGMGLVGIWVGTTLDWLLRATWVTAVFYKGKWKSRDV